MPQWSQSGLLLSKSWSSVLFAPGALRLKQSWKGREGVWMLLSWCFGTLLRVGGNGPTHMQLKIKCCGGQGNDRASAGHFEGAYGRAHSSDTRMAVLRHWEQKNHWSFHLAPASLSCGKEGNRYQIPQATEMISYYSEYKTSETWSGSQNHHMGLQELWLSLYYLINGTPTWLHFLFWWWLPSRTFFHGGHKKCSGRIAIK